MKITIKSYEETRSIETEKDDLTLEETMILIKDLLKSMYHHETVDKYWE